ncbi:major royal jelly protein-domain-containing protein, partial [Rhodofomes roseus]
MLSVLSTLAVTAVLVSAQSSIFDFPEYPPPGEYDPNELLASAVGTLPYGISVADQSLASTPVHYDTGFFGPQLELVHAYYDYWPTGVGVGSDGMVFTCYPRGNETYTLGLVTGPTTEEAWPNEEWNTPPAFENATNPGYSIVSDKLIFVQSVVVDGLDRVWALDTGRPRVNGTYLYAQVPGGPKLVGFYMNGTNFATYTFPSSVVYSDSSINDVRFDLRGGGYAYITDSSPYHAALIVVDLATGESWRHLDGHAAVSPDPNFVPVYNGGEFHQEDRGSMLTSHSVPFYYHTLFAPNAIQFMTAFAADGIALSADGEYVYVTPLTSRYLYRVPTSYLKQQPSGNNPYAALLAKEAVQVVAQSGGHADGLETDASGYIYIGSQEHNAIHRFNATTGIVEPFIRNPVIQWADTFSVVTLAEGNFLYFTVNQ